MGHSISTFALYRRLLAHGRPYWAHIIGLIALTFLATPLALLTPLPLKLSSEDTNLTRGAEDVAGARDPACGLGRQGFDPSQGGCAHVLIKLPEAPDQLRRQSDLGDQHQRRAAPRQGLFDGPQVDLGLAAPSHPVQKEGGEGAGSEGLIDRRQGRRLFGRGGHRAVGGGGGVEKGVAADLHLGLAQKTLLHQAMQGGVRGGERPAQFGERSAAALPLCPGRSSRLHAS